MSEATSVGVITLDLRIVNSINKQLSAIAASANKSAQQSFDGLGKTVEQSISKPIENVSKTIEKSITAPIEKANAAVAAPLKAVTEQFDQTADEIEAIAARAAKRCNDSLHPKDIQLPTTAPRIPSSGNQTAAEAAQYMDNWDPATMKLKEVQKQVEQIPKAVNNSNSAFSSLGAKIKSVFSSAQQNVQKTYADVTTGANKAVKSVNNTVAAGTSVSKAKSSGAFSAISKGASGLGRSVKSAFKSAFLMASLYAAFKLLKSYMSAASTQNKEFANSLNAVKANLMVAFTPIFQAIMPALTTLMNGLAAVTKNIAAFISGLFGKTYAQSVAATKKVQGAAAAATKAKSGSGSKSSNKDSLAGFDEVNVIGKKDSGAGGADSTGGINYDALNTKGTEAASKLAAKFKAAWAGVAAEFNDYVVQPIKDNLSKFDEPVAKFKALFADIGTQCVKWMAPISNWFKNDFKNALNVGISNGMTMWAGFMDSLAMVANTIWKTLQPAINWIVTKGLPMLTEMWVECSNTGVTAFEAIKTVFDTLWHGVIDPFAQFVSKVIVDILDTFKSLWDQYGATTFENIRAAITTTKDTFLNVWNSFLKPVFDQLFDTLNKLWTDHLQPLIAQIGEFVAKLVNGALEIYNGFIAPIVNWFVKTWGPPIAKAVGEVIKCVGSIVGAVADVAKNLFKALGGVVDFVVGVFTGNWGKAWNGVKAIFKGVFDALVDIAKVPLNAIVGMLNGVIGGINLLISGLNKIHFDIPDWVPKLGGKSFGISIPSIGNIPYLANGGILTQPTLAMMGEYSGAKSNPEIATPQSLMQETFLETMIPLLNVMEEFRDEVVGLLKALMEKDPNISLDGTLLARILKPYLDEEKKRVGGTIF